MSIADFARRVMSKRKGASTEVAAGIDNQTQLLNDRLREIVQGIDNQSRLINDLLQAVVQGLDNQSNLINDRLREVVQGVDNQSKLFAHRLGKLTAGSDNQSQLINTKFEKLIDGVKNQSNLFNRKLTEVVDGLKNTSGTRVQHKVAGDFVESSKTAHSTKFDPNSKSSPVVDRHSSLALRAGRNERLVAPIDGSIAQTIDLEAFRDVFAGIKPWSGIVPHKFIVDFLGMLVDIEFHPMLFTDPNFNPEAVGGRYEQTAIPRLADVLTPGDAEAWFEAVDWVLAAREARGRFVMITLGANYGAQAVAAYRALQTINPMPYKLVAVDPVPGNVEWIRRHMINNGIDPDQQWILPLAISDSVEPVFFPVGGPGVGSNNAYSTNERAARAQYAEEFIARDMSAEALRNLLLNNTTGLMKDLVPGRDFMAEIKLVSSITLTELLGPFETVDLLESDIQQSEILVFPGFLDVLRRKVRRIHIGTHGEDVHLALHNLFAEGGWEIVFSLKPNSKFTSSLGNFETNDGVLTVRNPDL